MRIRSLMVRATLPALGTCRAHAGRNVVTGASLGMLPSGELVPAKPVAWSSLG